MYKRLYNWNDYGLRHHISSMAGFNEFLERLYAKSLTEYVNGEAKNSTVIEQGEHRQLILDMVQNVENYLAGLIELKYVNFQNIEAVVEQLMKLDHFFVLPKNMRGIYGITQSNKIGMNPCLRSSKNLSSRERTSLYTFHELGHLLQGMHLKNRRDFCSKFANQVTGIDYTSLDRGFDLLDEALTQDIAENIAYFYAQKTRPRKLNYSLNAGSKLITYASNYDFYGELQEPAIKFGKTLRGIAKGNDNDDTALFNLGRMNLMPSFINDICVDYQLASINDLLVELYDMGIMKDAAYSRFGYGNVPNSVSLLPIVTEKFNAITTKNRDTRDRSELASYVLVDWELYDANDTDKIQEAKAKLKLKQNKRRTPLPARKDNS